MNDDTEEFLQEMGSDFAGAKVTASAPKPNYSEGDKLLKELSTKPATFGMNMDTVSMTDEEIAALPAPDAEFNLVRQDDTSEFMQEMGLKEPEAPKDYTSEKDTAMAAAKAMPQTTDRERAERDQAIRDAMRIGKDIQAPGLTGGDTRSKDFALGMSQTLMGIPATALDVARYTGMPYVVEQLGSYNTTFGKALKESGLDFDSLDQATQAKITELKNSVTDKDIFSANTLGQILPTVAALPAHASRKLTAALLDGAITYTMMQGAGNDDATSAIGAIVAGGLTSGTMALLERYKGTAALDDVVNNLAAGKNTDTIYKNFAKYTGKDLDTLTNHDKVVAILSSSDEQGAATLLRIASRDSKLKKSIDALMESPNDVVKSALEGNNIARTVNDLREQTKFAKTAYNDLEKLAIAYPTANINIGPAKQSLIDELSAIPEIKRSAGINKVLNTLSKENLSLADIIDMRKYLNGINFKASRVDMKTRESISAVEYLDSVVDANLPAEFKQVFGEARQELALSYALQGKNAKKKFNNKFSELTMEIGKGNETYATTLDKLVRASGGTNKFNELHRGLGYEQAKQFELGLIKEIQNSKGENLGELLDKIKDLGFVTPEARDMTKRIRMLDKAFSSADFYNEATRVAIAGGLDSASITNDFLSKVEYSVAGSIWNKVKPYVLPLSDTASQERMFRRIMSSVEKGLKSDTKAIKLEAPHVDMYKDFKPVIRDAIENSIRTQIDNLKGMSEASLPKGKSSNLLEAPANFTTRADGTTVRATGNEAQDMLGKEPINTTIVEEPKVPSTSRVPDEDIIDVETWTPTSTVVTPDGHILSIDDLLRGESLPDNMRLPEKASKPIHNFFDMKLKLKTDPDLIKIREEVKKAKTPETKSKAKDRLAKQLEYIKLREQGVKPSEAHRMALKSSSEAGGALAGGAMNGITIDDNGNVQVDTEKFLAGMAIGYAGVKGAKQLGKYIDEGNELMMQQAGGGTPPSSKGIEFNYKLTETINKLDDNAKFSPSQLKGYLLKQGVTENEIKASEIFNNKKDIPISGRNWKLQDTGKQNFSKTQYQGDDASFAYVSLNKKGIDDETYKVNEWMSKKQDLDTNLRHKMDSNSYTLQDYNAATQLGWNRLHQDTINGKPTTVLNELQSDWMQAERQNAGIFEKNAVKPSFGNLRDLVRVEKTAFKALSEHRRTYSSLENDVAAAREKYFSSSEFKELTSEIKPVQDKLNSWIKPKNVEELQAKVGEYMKRVDDKLMEIEAPLRNFNIKERELEKVLDDAIDIRYKIAKQKIIADFPMKPEKFQQFMIVDAINEAIENGTNRIAIPINREGSDLAGTAGVTKFYAGLDKQLRVIQDKLSKRGVKLELGKEELSVGKNPGSFSTQESATFLDTNMANLSDNDWYEAQKYLQSGFVSSKLRDDLKRQIDIAVQLNKEQTISNKLHTIEIKEIPGQKVRWDVYGLLGVLGLSDLAKELKKEENSK